LTRQCSHIDYDKAVDGTARTGVVVGKFNPPHLGHLHLIERGAAEVEHLYVLLCDRADQTIGADRRARWLADAAPANVSVLVTPDDLPAANEPWAARTMEVLPVRPEVAFTSESWGPEWASLMGARHVMVDLKRARFPVSGTRLRAELRSHFEWLVPAARAGLARRVVLIGAESTGKSTLAEALAQQLGTVWVPEYGRWYWEGRRYLADQAWAGDEFVRIASAQGRLEDDLARLASGGVVIADTDALVTAVWHERYLGGASAEVDRVAASRVPDLYLLCRPDFAWVQDGTRESSAHRASMNEAMRSRAERSGAAVVEVAGPHEQRLAVALAAIDVAAQFAPLV
jgi:HTH-type transcriptional regulator, transcriptional repressor of NAD biosynthesis genes